jgi:outer membrane protein
MKYLRNIIKILISELAMIVLVMVSNPSYAQAKEPVKLTLSQTIQYAVNNKPLIKEAQDQVSIATAKADELKSAFLPHAAISLNYNRIGPTPFISIPVMNNEKFYIATPNNFNENIGVQYLIYDFNKRKETLKLLRSNEVTEAEKINMIRNQLSYETAQVYFSILYLNSSVKVMDRQIKDLEEHLVVAKKLVATGSSIGLDTISTSVRLTALQNAKADIINQKKKASVILGSLMNFPKGKEFELEGKLEITSNQYKLDTLIKDAYLQREELKLNNMVKYTATLHKAVIEKSNMPTLSAFGTAGLKNGYPDNLTRMKANYVLGLTADIPVFDGFLKKSKLETADWQIQSITDHVDVLQQKVSTEVQNALLDYRNSKVQLKTALEETVQAEAAMKQATGLYESGSITNTTLLDTETALAQAKLKYSYQLFQLTLSHYKLLQAEGEKIW